MSSSCSTVSCLQCKHTEHTLAQEQLCWPASRQPGGLHCWPCICNLRVTAAASGRSASMPLHHCAVHQSSLFLKNDDHVVFFEAPPSFHHSICTNPPLPKYKTVWPHLERLKQRGQTVLIACWLIKHCWCVSVYADASFPLLSSHQPLIKVSRC